MVVALTPRDPLNTTRLVARLGCKSKNCDRCWPGYRKLVTTRLTSAFAPEPGKWSSSPISSLYIGLDDQVIHRLTRRARRSGASFVVIPLVGGLAALLVNRGTTEFPEMQPCQDVQAWVGQALDRHDRSRRMRCSNNLQLTKPDPSAWTLEAVSKQDAEKAYQLAWEAGLDPEWNGPNCFYILNPPKASWDAFLQRMESG